MTNQEFLDEFEILYNNVTSNLAPGLDPYEISVFLTKALDELVKDYFNPSYNKSQEGFDNNQRRLIDFSMLVKNKEYTAFANPLFDTHSNTKSVDIPTDAYMIINEMALVVRRGNQIALLVKPINFLEYSRLMSKPYKRPSKETAWRIINNNSSNKADVIIGSSDTLFKYIVRYVKRPKAIILTDLDGVTIDGSYKSLECELDPILHKEILLRAVELAKASYLGDLNSQLALGQMSATEKGIVTRGL